MYILLCGYPPFYGENDSDVLARVKLGKFTFVSADWKNVSNDACDLITKMLKKEAATRATAQQALEHVWIAEKAPKVCVKSMLFFYIFSELVRVQFITNCRPTRRNS